MWGPWHEGDGPQTRVDPNTRGSVWEMLPRAISAAHSEHLPVPHRAASPLDAFAPQRDQKASSPLIAGFSVERLPDYLTISCAH